MKKTQNFSQGYFTPTNPGKYIGDITKIVYRSSWELQFNKFLDSNTNILNWASEPFPIKYIKPTDNKIHEYWPDYYIKYMNNSGAVIEELVEVKPKKQTQPSTSRVSRHRLYENLTFAINTAKWESAVRYCEQIKQQTGRDIQFRIISEDQLFK